VDPSEEGVKQSFPGAIPYNQGMNASAEGACAAEIAAIASR
jgi:hypothetical protein